MTQLRPYATPGSPTISPIELSRMLGQAHQPTEQQAAVIGAEPTGAFLVVAGAGAGKTETMAARVVWLVANGYVLPEQVLGLTFTRKAAAELGDRVRSRLETLAHSTFMDTLEPQDPRRSALAHISPTVATYDSFAGSIVREYGLLVPVEPTGRILSEAEEWMLTRDVVRDHAGGFDMDLDLPRLVEHTRTLAQEMDNHLASEEAVAEQTRAAIANCESMIASGSAGRPNKDTEGFLETQKKRLEILELVVRFRETLAERNLMTFGHQMSLAASVADEHPLVGQQMRERFRVVLFDEYQDTGHSQRVLLRSLFGAGQDDRLSVTAVGDPMQSIYGFRGATASNLEKFRQDFESSDGAEAPKLQLTTSWRNPREVLAMANEVSGWAMEAQRLVEALQPGPNAGEGQIGLAFYDDEEQELEWLADQLEEHWAEYQRAVEAADDPATVAPFSAAVLIRKNSQALPIYTKLVERGVPADMTAGPGLLDVPEVADVYAALRVLVDPADDVALLRLLTGPRWHIGAADLTVLARRAQQVASRGQREDEDFDELDEERRAELIAEHQLGGFPDSLVDLVLGLLPDRYEVGAGLADALADSADLQDMGMSATGARRMGQLSAELGYLRRHSMGKPLNDLVADIENMMGVRTEVLGRWYRDPSAGLGTSHLDEFANVVRSFSEISSASPAALVEYLRVAHDHEGGLKPGEVAVKKNTVQILTVHKAKGLEWDIVAVPHATRATYEDAEATNSRESTWLTACDQLPTELRGDAVDDGVTESMPIFDSSAPEKYSEFSKAMKEFTKSLKQYRAKEAERVFYVAVTRTQRVLYASGAAFGSGSTPRDPAVYFRLMARYLEKHRGGAGIVEWSDLGKCYTDKTLHDEVARTPQPREHVLLLPDEELNARRAQAKEERSAMARTEDVEEAASWPRDSALLDIPGAADGAGRVDAALARLRQGGPEGGEPVVASEDKKTTAALTQAESWAREAELLIAEFQREQEADVEVPLDVRLTATDMVALRANEQEFARRKRRPVPLEPKPFAKRGTAFHNWVEQRFDSVSLLDEDQLPGAADATLRDPQLERLKKAFLGSEWAERQPASVEGACSVTLGEHVFEGRIDAVYHFSDDPQEGWMIVDWKTGKVPIGEDLDAAMMQLAVYRVAWAKVLSHRLGVHVPAENVRAAFHYVAFNETLEPRTLPTAEQIAEMLG